MGLRRVLEVSNSVETVSTVVTLKSWTEALCIKLRQSSKVESEILLVGSYFKSFPFQLLVLFWETAEPLGSGTQPAEVGDWEGVFEVIAWLLAGFGPGPCFLVCCNVRSCPCSHCHGLSHSTMSCPS